ncbi:plasmid recombination protein [Butyrivibrio sp. XPD2006]|uniref:plasmid recombination protein n=1 Tax=Butyrivibrio sp. XPD2006 TaxID=1280668 RepID=UPI0004231AE4|nr:plasmid recombination protein [Butyrivibrio sp. XPD2006]
MDGIDGYVSFRQEPKFNILHTIRDPEYMKKEEANYYAYYEKRKADGVLPPDFIPEPFHVHMEDADKNVLLHYEPLKEFYEKTFQPAVDEYDQILLHDGKGHKDRVKGNYYSYIYQHDTKKNSTKLAYEVVAQFGGRDDDEKNGVKGISDDPEKREQCLEGLKRYYEQWKRENPNLHIVAAAIHMDETSPHLHIIYVPVVESERGQKVRNDRSTALKAQLKMHGIDISKNGRQENATTAWQERQRVVLREIAKEVGLDMKQTKKPTQRDHEDAREYRARRSADALESANDTTKYLIQENDKKLDTQEAQIEENSKILFEQENKKKENSKTLTEQERKKVEYEAFTKTFHQPTDYKKVKIFGKKETHYAVPEQELWSYCAAADDVKQKDEQIQGLEEERDDFKKKYAKANNARDSAEKQRDKYKGYKTEKDKQIADFEKRFSRAKKNPYTSASTLSGLIHEYALLKVDSEKERAAIIKACEALDTLDEYHHKIDKNIPFFTLDDDADRLSTSIQALNGMVKNEYLKILDYGGRKEMYSEISDIWTASKSVSSEIYKKYGSKHKHASSINTLQTQYTPIITGILSDLFSLVRMAFEMIQEAQYGYGR